MTAGEQAGVAAAEASYATDTIRVDYDPDAVGADELPERLSVAGTRQVTAPTQTPRATTRSSGS